MQKNYWRIIMKEQIINIIKKVTGYDELSDDIDLLEDMFI